jgi:signal transduction histidine kinase
MLSKKEHRTKGITIKTNYADNMPQIKAISDQIKQVILNLLSNAAYACEGSGTINISTVETKDTIEIAIEDNGKGIKPEHINQIFDPFFTTRPEVKGTGLGLSISYGIIKKHGGIIDVKSEPGRGTTFTVTLPIEGIKDAE